jgi:NhaP-type Na+/H+ and K+/H+ antiporter
VPTKAGNGMALIVLLPLRLLLGLLLQPSNLPVQKITLWLRMSMALAIVKKPPQKLVKVVTGQYVQATRNVTQGYVRREALELKPVALLL